MISVHPGEYISALIQEQCMSKTELSKRLGVSVATASRLVNEKSDVTATMAIKLSYVFDRTAESWLSMQSDYNLSIARNNIALGKTFKAGFRPTGDRLDAIAEKGNELLNDSTGDNLDAYHA